MWCVIFLPNIGTVEPWNLLPGYKAGLWSYVLCLVWYVIKLCFAMCGYVRYVVLCCVMLHLSCCGMFCYVTLRSVTFRYVVVCCVMLCRVMSCHATLCHVMLCNVMLCYGMDACIYAIGSYPAAPIVFSVHSRLQTRQRRLLQNEPIVVYTSLSEREVGCFHPEIVLSNPWKNFSIGFLNHNPYKDAHRIV